MLRKTAALCITLLILFGTASSADQSTAEDNRRIILFNDYHNEVRNRLWVEDIRYLQKELPKLHKNLFHSMSEDAFAAMTDALIGDVDTLTNPQIFVRLGQIIAAAGDAHTTIDYWDGCLYPLSFWLFGGDVYIVDTDDAYGELRCAKVLEINGIAIGEVILQLAGLIPHENENWLMAVLPQYIQKPLFLFGLGLIPDENSTVFTVEKDGAVNEVTVDILDYQGAVQYDSGHPGTKLTGGSGAYYAYEYMPGDQILYLEYNVCADAPDLSFADFCAAMFMDMEALDVNTVVVDLRNNTGGNSEIFNAFTQKIGSYMNEHADTKLYVAVGRRTFSSGIFAILRIMEAAPGAVVIGEPTGGSVDGYGDTRSLALPNSRLPVTYCTKYFELSRRYGYSGDPAAYAPDILVRATIEDYCGGTDPLMAYIRAH